MTIHIGAAPGDIAETVLMPGDPLRAKWAAETFLDEAVCVNDVRGMLGFTGRWRGNRVTIHGSGMGMPSLSIYANELIRDYGAKDADPDWLDRRDAGACQIAGRDLAMTASSISTPSRGIFRELNFAPCADFGLLQAAHAAAALKGVEGACGRHLFVGCVL
jgi:purine-nucleoside phosphorylase